MKRFAFDCLILCILFGPWASQHGCSTAFEASPSHAAIVQPVAVLKPAALAPPVSVPDSGVADVHLPTFPVPTPPVPPQPPTTPQKLLAGVLYVIESDAAYITLASPSGYLQPTEETGPLRIRAVFVDSNGKAETRTYKGKFITILEAAATGRCELIVIPSGATKASQVLRRTLDVDNGTQPIPPGPGPDPVPPTDPFTKALQAAYNLDADADKAKRLDQLTSLMTLAVAEANDPQYTTNKQLADKMHVATEKLVGAGAFMPVRRAIGAYMDSQLATKETPMTPDLRAKISAVYAKIAAALKGVKP